MKEMNTPAFKTYLNQVITKDDCTNFDKNILLELTISLDSNGYFRQDVNIFVQILKQNQLNISTIKLEDLIKKLQSLTPYGFGATNLQECLILQIKGANSFPKDYCSESHQIALEILENHFDSFSKKRFDLLYELSSSKAIVDKAILIILSLQPKPDVALINHN